MAHVSLRAFARMVGVSHTAVQKAVRTGRLAASVDHADDGSVLGIDPELGREEWQLTALTDSEPLRAPPSVLVEGEMSYAEARAVREFYTAKLAQLEYEARTGALIPAAAVKDSAFKTGRAVRSALELIPDRLAAILAVESDPARVHALLADAINDALLALTAR